MQREQLANLAAFVAGAEEFSFTRAAGKLGIPLSLSHTILRLESNLALRLLGACRLLCAIFRLSPVLSQSSAAHTIGRPEPQPMFAICLTRRKGEPTRNCFPGTVVPTHQRRKGISSELP